MPGGVGHVKGRDKRGLNSVQHCGKNCGFVPEAHLALGRVHVDVHLRRVHFHKKHYLRIVTAGHAALVGFAHGGQQAFVRDGSAVDIEQDAVAAWLVFALPPALCAIAVAAGRRTAAFWSGVFALAWFSHAVMVAWTRPPERVFACSALALSLLVVFAASVPGLRARFSRKR